MAKDNIYDLVLAELITRSTSSGGSGSTSGVARLVLTNTLGSNEVPALSSTSVTFTSEILNMPSGYSISGNSHVISYPNAAQTAGNTETVTGSPVSVIPGNVGNVYTVTATVTLTHATLDDVVLTTENVITAVTSGYFGVKAFSSSPDITDLTQIASTTTSVQFTSSTIGRIYIALPMIVVADLVSVTGPEGLIYTVGEDLIKSGVTGYNFYILNYDTQLTGTNLKTFTLNFS